MTISHRHLLLLKLLLHLAGLLPVLWLFWQLQDGGLSADPAKDIQHFTGLMAIRLLLGTLLIAPLAVFLRQPLLMRTRRQVGLWTFFWASLHLSSYVLLEIGINNPGLLVHEIFSRPYLILGSISWVLLLLLTVTSLQWLRLAMGKRWQMLHNGIYLVAVLAPIHFLLSVKVLSPQPIIYAGIATGLLLFRVIRGLNSR